jgi:hypothetical protein
VEWILLTSLAVNDWDGARYITQIYECRWLVEICQSQPIKLSWRPLRLLAATMIYLRGLGKREDIGDINLLSHDNDFFNQTLHDGLAVLEREAIEVVAQQLTKALGIVDDLLPVGRLVVRLC